MIRFEGRVFEDGNHWLVEVPALRAATQGRNRAEALEMVADLLETMADRPGFRADVRDRGEGRFDVGSTCTDGLVAILLQQRRKSSGLSLARISERLGQRSRNAYARYERGRASPTLAKLASLLEAVDPDHDLVISFTPR